MRGPEMSTGAPKSDKPALLGARHGVPAMPRGKSAVSVAYLRHIRIRKLNLSNVPMPDLYTQWLRGFTVTDLDEVF
jgi:hypothetical protein